MTTAVRADRIVGSTLRHIVRAVGARWRRFVPGDGADSAPPIVLPPRASILVLQLQQVGDSLMMSPVLRAIRHRYPDASIDVLTMPVGYDIYKRCPYVRTQYVIRAPGAGPWRGLRRVAAWWRTIRAVRRTHFDCVLACRNHVSINYVLAALATGARHRVGFDEAAGGFLFTRRLQVRGQESVLETNLALASAIDADPAQGREEFWFASEDAAFVETLLDRRGVPPDARLAVIHPASNWQSKTWYPDRWAAVADWLVAEEGFQIVFVGRGRDAEVIGAVQGMMTRDSWSLAGDTDLSQLGALLARADLFIGTDSGPRHIAGALGRPQVTIMSSLDEPWRWRLDRPQEVILRTDPPCHGCMQSQCSHRLCLDLIPADQVIAACRELLSRAAVQATQRIYLSV